MDLITPVAFRDEALDILETKLGESSEVEAQDEEFWLGVRDAFSLDPEVINFNNGGCSPSPRVVGECLKRQIDYANRGPSIYMWRDLDPEIEGVRKRLAALFGADAEEIAITRNASESLMTCLFGLPIASGDEVLTSSQDYPRMINAIRQLERRNGVKMIQAQVPTAPDSKVAIIRAFEKQITSKTRMILISHVGFMNGQINPVREICDMGRARGIPVIVDGAHAFAHFPFVREDLACDYFGTSLHKWLMAPVGTGMLYVKREAIEPLWPLMAPGPTQDRDIRKFEEIGTHQAAVHNAIDEALTFHEILGTERKYKRLRYLRSRWTDTLAHLANVRFFTNLYDGHSCSICTVGIDGIKPGDLATWLEKNHRIVVAGIDHPDINGVRVSPQVYTSVEEVDRFAKAMAEAATVGIG